MNVNYEYYHIFYYVAKYGNFTKAANVLGSNQPNVTRAMNRLEQELGCKLFARTNRGATLTPEGQQLLSHVEVAQQQLQEGEAELSGSAGLQNGSISIGVSETALNIFLLEKLRDFHALYPNIRLRISNHSTPQAIAAIKRGTIDLAVVTTPADTQVPLHVTPLMPFDEVLVGGPAFSSLSDKALHLRDLENYSLICLGRNTMSYAFYERLFLRHGLVLQPDTEAATTNQVLPLVKYDLGLAFLPEPFAHEALERCEICRIPLAEPIPQRQVCLVRDTRRPLSVAARAFEKLLYGEE